MKKITPKQKAIDLIKEYKSEAIWFIERRKQMPDDELYWQRVYKATLKLVAA